MTNYEKTMLDMTVEEMAYLYVMELPNTNERKYLARHSGKKYQYRFQAMRDEIIYLQSEATE